MPKPLESITAARKAANACRHFMWGTTLTEGDLESKLIPLIRRELAKKEPANYWTVTISDNAGWTLQDIADKAFGIIASKGIDLEGKGAVVAMKDSVLEPGSALVECERVERDDEVAKLVNRACARRWGLARGANHPLVPLTLDVEGLPEPVPTTANLIVGRRNEGTQPSDRTERLPVDGFDVSRAHGEFFYCKGGWYFRDLGSTNGSRIDGKEIGDTSVEIQEGSVILLASSVRIVVLSA